MICYGRSVHVYLFIVLNQQAVHNLLIIVKLNHIKNKAIITGNIFLYKAIITGNIRFRSIGKYQLPLSQRGDSLYIERETCTCLFLRIKHHFVLLIFTVNLYTMVILDIRK